MNITTDKQIVDFGGATGLQVSTATLAGLKVKAILTGSKTHDFASTATGAYATTTVTVTGAALGDICIGVSLSVDISNAEAAPKCYLNGFVSAADTVTAVFFNATGNTIDLASATLRAVVLKI